MAARRYNVGTLNSSTQTVRNHLRTCHNLSQLPLWGRSGTSDLEKRTGADKQQARAIGGLLLFLAGFVIIEFMLLLK